MAGTATNRVVGNGTGIVPLTAHFIALPSGDKAMPRNRQASQINVGLMALYTMALQCVGWCGKTAAPAWHYMHDQFALQFGPSLTHREFPGMTD
jgi:hypothetical protein